ncbi:MAG: hypothetical protein R3F17_12515 [Planctomycetota bacterium]
MTQLVLYYHRDFDGMVSAAVLARILRKRGASDIRFQHINYDQKRDWRSLPKGNASRSWTSTSTRARSTGSTPAHDAIGDSLRGAHEPSESWAWDPESPTPARPDLAHAERHWGITPRTLREMAWWSDIIDATRKDNGPGRFADDPALRIMRSLTVAPHPNWIGRDHGRPFGGTLDSVANHADVDKAYARRPQPATGPSNVPRHRALEARPDPVLRRGFQQKCARAVSGALLPPSTDLSYAVGVIPTRAGFHITCGENPWNQPQNGVHVGRCSASTAAVATGRSAARIRRVWPRPSNRAPKWRSSSTST